MVCVCGRGLCCLPGVSVFVRGQFCEDISKHQEGPSCLPDLCLVKMSIKFKRHSMTEEHLCLSVEFTRPCHSPELVLCVSNPHLLSLVQSSVSQPIPHLKGQMTSLSFRPCLFNCRAVMGPALIPNLRISSFLALYSLM